MADNQIKIDLLINTANAATTIGAQKKAIRELLSEMGNVEEGSSAFTKLSQAAGELQDKMADTRNQAKFFADDMKNLSGLAAVGRGIAGGFAVLQGTMGLLSGESEELQKAMQKVQITMGIIQGIQEVATLLNKDETASIFLKNVANKLFNKTKQEQVVTEVAATAATTAGVVATNATTAATGRATIATRIWNTVLKANPIFLLVSVLAAVAAGIYYFAKATDSAKVANDALNKTLEFQNELFRISRARQEADADARIKLAESAGASNKEILELELERSKQEEANDKASYERLEKTIEKKRKLRSDAIFEGNDELATSINDEIKTLQKESDAIYENFNFRAGVGNKYYVDRKILQNKYDQEALKEQAEANKKASDAQIKAQADLLAKKKEFAQKMLEVDQYIKDQSLEIEVAKVNAIESQYLKELSLIEVNKNAKIEQINSESTAEIKIVTDALEARYGLKTKAYTDAYNKEVSEGGRITTLKRQQEKQITQITEDAAKERNETLKKLEEERQTILRETTKAVISPEEFTRFTEYLTSELDKVYTTVEGNTTKIVKRISVVGKEMLTTKQIDDYRKQLDMLNWSLTNTIKEYDILKAGGTPEFADESSLETLKDYEDEISRIKTEIISINTTLSNDISIKTSEEGIKKLASAYANSVDDVTKDIFEVSNAVKNGNGQISSSIDEFSNDIYGKIPTILSQLFSLDEKSQADSLQKTSEYNIKMASLYLDKYKTISDITKGQSVQDFTVPRDGSDVEKARVDKNTKELKEALDKRYTILKKAAKQNYEDELFEAYKQYSSGKINAEQYAKELENIKQKNVDNLLDIDIAYGVASQEQLADAEQKKLEKLKAAAEKEKAIRQRAADTWVQTVQNSISEVNKLIQQQYSNEINNVGLAYNAKKTALDNEWADYQKKEANYSLAEQQKMDKEAEYKAKKEQLDKDQAEAERSVKIKQFNAQKATDAIQVGINTTLAISKTVAELGGVGAITPAGIALIAAMAVQGAVAEGFILSAQPAFATGGLVSGPGGPKDDKISARLSNGEAVINAKSTAMYKPILSAINQAGGGVAFPMADGGIAKVPTMVNGNSDMDEFKSLVYDIISRPVETYVKESSVTNAQRSISRQDRRTSF